MLLYTARIMLAIVVFLTGAIISYWLFPTGSNLMVKNASLLSRGLFRVRVSGAQHLQDISARTPIIVAFSHRADTDQLLVLSELAKLDPRFEDALLMNESTHYSFRKNPFGYIFAGIVCGWRNVSRLSYSTDGEDRRPLLETDYYLLLQALGKEPSRRPVLAPAWYQPRYENWRAVTDGRMNVAAARLSMSLQNAVIVPVSVMYHQPLPSRRLARQHPWLAEFRPLASVEIREPIRPYGPTSEQLGREGRLRELQIQVVDAIEG